MSRCHAVATALLAAAALSVLQPTDTYVLLQGSGPVTIPGSSARGIFNNDGLPAGVQWGAVLSNYVNASEGLNDIGPVTLSPTNGDLTVNPTTAGFTVKSYSPTNGSYVSTAWARITIYVVPAAPAADSYASQSPTPITPPAGIDAAKGFRGPLANDFPAVTQAAIAAYSSPAVLAQKFFGVFRLTNTSMPAAATQLFSTYPDLGGFTLVQADNWTGAATFKYRITALDPSSNTTVQSAEATVSLRINAPVKPIKPVAVDAPILTVTSAPGTPVAIKAATLAALFTDPDGFPGGPFIVMYDDISGVFPLPAGAVVSQAGPNADIVFTPATGFKGSAVIGVAVSDGFVDSLLNRTLPTNGANVLINFNGGKAPLSPPTLGPVSASCASGRALSFFLTAGADGAPAGVILAVTGPLSARKPKTYLFSVPAPLAPSAEVQFPGSPTFPCTGKCITALKAVKKACGQQFQLEAQAAATRTSLPSPRSAAQPFTLDCEFAAATCTGL